MKKCSEIVLLLFVVSYCFTFVQSDITLGPVKCEKITCKKYEYCSTYTTACDSCSNICNSTSHNFDRGECVSKCQGKLIIA